MSQDTTRTADEALLHIQKVDKYTITPISFGKMALVAPKLHELVDKIAALSPEDNLGTAGVIQIGFTLFPDFIPVIALVLDVPQEEIEALPAATGMQLLTAIWAANATVFFDFFQIAASVTPMLRVAKA